MEFIKDKDYQYTSRTEKTLEELKNAATQEQYYSESEQEFEALKKKLSHNNEQDLLKFKSEIMGMIKNEIIARYYFDRGRIEASLGDDVDAIKAVEVLNNKILYTSIIDGTYEAKGKTEDK